MTESHRLAISRGARRGQSRRDAEFAKLWRAAGYSSQNEFAAALGVSVASLSRYRDKRPIPKEKAERAKELLKAAVFWPGGIAED